MLLSLQSLISITRAPTESRSHRRDVPTGQPDDPIRPITLSGPDEPDRTRRRGRSSRLDRDRWVAPAAPAGDRLSARSITLAGVPDPASYRPAPGHHPGLARASTGSAIRGGRVIYVGKAKSLRQRLNSYFADIGALHPRTAQMVTSAGGVEWTVVSTEVEALQLEYNWIKEFDPRFNVRYRDDKSYPELAVTLGEEYPRLQVMRGPHRKGVRYFGPYAHAWAIRETLDLLLRVFPARTCSAGVFRRSQQIGRPCLLGYIGKCSAPCTGRVTAEEHREIVDDFCDFMAGKADPLIRRLEQEMAAAAAELDFEKAARLRDDLGALRRAVEKQAVVLGDGTDADVVGIAADDLLASVQVFHVRGGRVRGQRGWIVDVDADSAGPGRALGVAGGELPAAVLRRPGRRRRRDRGAAGDPGARCCPAQRGRPPRRELDRLAVRSCAGPGCRCGCRSAATSARWPRPSPATPPRR